MKYSKQWFIEFFEDIPEERWLTNGVLREGNKACAMGHLCAVNMYGHPNSKQRQLKKLIDDAYGEVPLPQARIFHINNGKDRRFKQKTAKKRVLAALKGIK